MAEFHDNGSGGRRPRLSDYDDAGPRWRRRYDEPGARRAYGGRSAPQEAGESYYYGQRRSGQYGVHDREFGWGSSEEDDINTPRRADSLQSDYSPRQHFSRRYPDDDLAGDAWETYRGDYGRGRYGEPRGPEPTRRGSDDPYYGNYSQGGASGDVGRSRAGYQGKPAGWSRSRSFAGSGTRSGGHRGKGPRGFVRSDERMTEEVSERLMMDEDVDAGGIDVSVQNGEVTLSGTVASKFAKRRAEDCADSILGVGHVQNNLRVSQHVSGQQEGSGT